jgi:hypothetical protein
MGDIRVKGAHRIEVSDKYGEANEATLEINYRRVRILPPIGKQKRYPSLTLTPRMRRSGSKGENRLEIDHRSTRPVAQGRH